MIMVGKGGVRDAGNLVDECCGKCEELALPRPFYFKHLTKPEVRAQTLFRAAAGNRGLRLSTSYLEFISESHKAHFAVFPKRLRQLHFLLLDRTKLLSRLAIYVR